MQIIEDDFTGINEDFSSINRAINRLNFIARDMRIDADDLSDYQAEATQLLQIVADYSSLMKFKCKALIHRNAEPC